MKLHIKFNFFRLIQKRIMAERALHSERLHTIAVCQLTSTNDKEKNFEICETLIRRARDRNAEMVFLPENFDYIGTSIEETRALAYSENDPYMERFRQLARELKVWLSLGGFHEKGGDNRSHNSHLILNDQGQTVGKYRKLHLFDIDIKNNVRIKESDFTIHGDSIIPPVSTAIGKIGLSTCYDLRFPEQAQILRSRGAEILTYPSAFTLATGMAHWEPLLRARAIETQCYVVAAAQTGKHNEKRISYGHSMVVDPWGKVIAECSEGAGLCIAEIDLDYVRNVRTQVPCQTHRRNDLYALTSSKYAENPDIVPIYKFSHHDIPSRHVFLRTPLSYAFINIKPVLKGHVLVSPLRCVKRLTEMTISEIADLFGAVQWVQEKLEQYHNVTSTTVTVQDGPLAGQTVEHVHVHILPRREGDFKENEIYHVLSDHDKGEKAKTGLRDPDEMAKESAEYRKLFYPSVAHL